MRSISILLLLMASATMAYAKPRLHDLDIRVMLGKNGDAHITETRQMTVDGNGTECYIGLGNMSPSMVKDLSVSDETIPHYENIGAWKVKRSRKEKTGQCGIIEKDGGYELCWGIGNSGRHTYVTSYTITDLVRGYPDADALRHVFLDQSVKPKPEHAKVTIMGADTTLVFTPETCGIWGFRFEGDLRFENGMMVAETTEPMSSKAALYVMAQFPKGMLEPSLEYTNDTFEHKKQLAFEGSDYGDGATKEEKSFGQIMLDVLKILGMIAGGLAALGGLTYLYLKAFSWYKRKKHEKWARSVDYFRSLPLGGNLQQANDMLNAFNFGKVEDYKRLVSAMVLKLINERAFGVEPVMTATGETAKRFVVKASELPLERNLPPLAYKMHEIFKKASGKDRVLDPQELETFMKDKNNRKLIRSFVDLLCTQRNVKYYKRHQDETLEVYGFKRFLDDFTLMNEHHMTETQLWREYMVWATLYGNAEQVKKDMEAINPEFFKMDEFANQLLDSTILPAVCASVYQGTDHMLNTMALNRQKSSPSSKRSHYSTRSSGGGGHSSWGGGGGGFSGGGGGGGIR